MRRNRSDLCQCLLQTAIRSSASSMPIERRTCPSQILEAYLPPQCHVEVTPGRGVPDKISIVCLTGAAHYILSSNMPQVFLLRALPPVLCASAAKATGFVRYRWLLFFTESVCIRPRRGLQGGFSSTPSPNILRFLPYSYMM